MHLFFLSLFSKSSYICSIIFLQEQIFKMFNEVKKTAWFQPCDNVFSSLFKRVLNSLFSLRSNREGQSHPSVYPTHLKSKSPNFEIFCYFCYQSCGRKLKLSIKCSGVKDTAFFFEMKSLSSNHQQRKAKLLRIVPLRQLQFLAEVEN